MPWTLNDYPASMKNMKEPIKKKAIDIANAMLEEGYQEGRAIPIAIEKSKEWYEDHSEEEVKGYMEHGDTAKHRHRSQAKQGLKRLDEDEFVVPHENGWAVISNGAKRASNVYDKKSDAIRRAEEIAENKGTGLKIEDSHGKVQQEQSNR